jgi:GAF domain-containing protein
MTSEGFIDPAAVDRSLATLRQRTSSTGLTGALDEVITTTTALFSASGAGVMMVDDGTTLCAVAATDEPGRLLEQRQEQSGRGPCVDSLTFDRVIHTADLAADDRWPELCPELPDAGVRAVLGVPIHASGVAVGSLNIYRDHPSEWSESEASALEAYGKLIEGLLLTALQNQEREQLVEQLQHALDHRVIIERAVGVVMGRQRVDAVTAFNRLRERARSSQRKVADIATDVLTDITDR